VDSGGDEVLSAAAQGIHVRYVMTQYSRYPSALFALASSGIRTPADLRGKSIGVPGKYGASYVGLLVLLKKAGISPSAAKIETIGYTQVQSVATHKVDAAVGYAMNEPVELHSSGVAVSEMDIANWANIAGAGLAAGDTFIARHPAAVKAFVAATLHGMRDTLKNPNQAFAITERSVPSLKPEAKVQRAILMRALDFWRAEPGHPLGWIDPKIWSVTGRLLYQFKQIPHQVKASDFYTERFIPAG
jgi:NitT/TauT family transport system substrate-binding protein